MRTFTFIFLSLFASLTVSAQLFIVNSPDDVAGSYDFSTPPVGDEWGANLADSVWCGNLMLVDPADGCTAISTDLAGDVAVVDRGTCNFSIKAWEAELAGASACIIVNNQPGFLLVGMLPGTNAELVTIPVIFITLEAGDAIKAAMSDGTVNVCMGNIVFDNNVASGLTEVSAPFSATVPFPQIEAAASAGFTPLARILNDGVEDAHNVTTTAEISFAPDGGSASQIYSEMAATELLPSGDTVLHELAAFDYSGSDIGSYTVNYEITMDSIDGLTSDNSANYSFDVTENVFAEGQWDYANNRPLRTFATTIGGVEDGDPNDWELVSSFEVPVGVGYRIDSVQYYVEINTTDQPTLDGITVKTKLYEWMDANEDGAVTNDEVALVAFNNWEFSEADGEGRWITVNLQDNLSLDPSYVIPSDGNVYFVGLEYSGPLGVEFGFNDDYSFGLLNNLNLLNTDADPPYLLSTMQIDGLVDFEDLGVFGDGAGGIVDATATTAMYINGINTAVTVLDDNEASIALYPNPASQQLNTIVELDEQTSKLTYSIMDMQGRQIFYVEKFNVTKDQNEFNVEQLPAGVYNMNITTDKGIKTERFNVQH
ncbi:MAG: hypothetical protein ACI9XB_004137 [Gammaproteobacteria bacterium]|jgi:hypothetical protein